MARFVTAFVLTFIALVAALCGGAGAIATEEAPAAQQESAAPRISTTAVALPSSAPFYKWGVGWDAGRGFAAGGVAIRRRIDDEWGLGFIIDANVNGGDDESNSDDHDQSGYGSSDRNEQSTSDFTSDAYGIRGFAFHETRLTRWCAIGPYFGLGYGFDRRDNDDLRVSTRVSDSRISTDRRETMSTRTAHSWAFTVGFRPSFTFEERFILETRLGVTAIWSNVESTSTTYRTESGPDEFGDIKTSSSVDRGRSDDDGWRFTAFGQELGPGAVLSFIVCF